MIGGAVGNYDEFQALQAMTHVDAVYAVNHAAVHFPGRLRAFVTLHPEPSRLPGWIAERRSLGLPDPDEVIGHEALSPAVTRVVPYVWPGMNASGSSGLFAAKVALEDFDRVVLCGVPMDGSVHRYSGQSWDFEPFRDAWKIALPHLRDRVRSFNGWTRDLLGPPTPDWLASA